MQLEPPTTASPTRKQAAGNEKDTAGKIDPGTHIACHAHVLSAKTRYENDGQYNLQINNNTIAAAYATHTKTYYTYFLVTEYKMPQK